MIMKIKCTICGEEKPVTLMMSERLCCSCWGKKEFEKDSKC